jgi:xylulose-5-phosphate/fructose-6-phosphate phosphoketolase
MAACWRQWRALHFPEFRTSGWTSNNGDDPQMVITCTGDVPTLETFAAITLLSKQVLDLRIRVVNVVDLMRLVPAVDHPHGEDNPEFENLFTRNKPVMVAFRGYPGSCSQARL